MEGAHRAHEQGDRGRRLSDRASLWSGATYERIAESLAPIHARIVETLAPAPGDRLLDLACGTGGVALLAARTGAEVVGLDISPEQLAKARAAADEAGFSIRFDEGDCEELPYGDGEFDAVASAFGIIFAPDPARAAGEITRVCRSGARLALTAWPDDEWARLNRRLRPEQNEGTKALDWAEESFVRAQLPAFELAFERARSVTEASSAEALWELLSTSVPPLKAWLEGLDEAGRERAAGEYLPLLAGGRLERDYVLVTGTRR